MTSINSITNMNKMYKMAIIKGVLGTSGDQQSLSFLGDGGTDS